MSLGQMACPIDDDDDLIIIKKYCRKGTTYTGLLRCSNMVSFEQGTILIVAGEKKNFYFNSWNCPCRIHAHHVS